MSKVYSYLRFSSPKQAAGTSAARQAEYAATWAAQHGMVLDESLSMRDEGLSAYSQAHVKNGALGVFLAAVNAGQVPAGSVLIVEGLDRLSRAEPMVAQPQLAQIVNAGITVVTAADNKTYSRESLKANPMDLLYSLLVMIRAHEESETKSKRIIAGNRRRCEAWVAGTYRGRIVSGVDPGWVRWNGTAYEFIPERAEALRLAVNMYLAGQGFERIARCVEGAGLVLTGKQTKSYLYSLLRNSALAGVRTQTAGGEEFQLEGYYPRLLNEVEFARLQVELSRRRQQPRAAGGKGEYPGIFSGLLIARCGHCGGSVVGQNQQKFLKSDGSPVLYRKLRCSSCYDQKTKERGGRASVAAGVVEKAILDYCGDQMNLQSLSPSDDGRLDDMLARKATLSAQIAESEARSAKLLDTMLSADGDVPQMLLRKAREMENEVHGLKGKLSLVDAQLAVASQTIRPDLAAEWQAIKAGVLALDFDSRIKCRQLVADTFSKVGVYFRGRRSTPHNAIDLLLVSKVGVSRWLQIDRKTGEFITGGSGVISPIAG